jgi:hypothetical protein
MIERVVSEPSRDGKGGKRGDRLQNTWSRLPAMEIHQPQQELKDSGKDVSPRGAFPPDRSA